MTKTIRKYQQYHTLQIFEAQAWFLRRIIRSKTPRDFFLTGNKKARYGTLFKEIYFRDIENERDVLNYAQIRLGIIFQRHASWHVFENGHCARTPWRTRGRLKSSKCIPSERICGPQADVSKRFLCLLAVCRRSRRTLRVSSRLEITTRNFMIDLKRPQVIETRAFPRTSHALITAKTQLKIHFVQYLNFN